MYISNAVTIWHYITYDTVRYAFEANIRAVGVDDVHGFVYWADSTKIKRATQHGSNTKVVISGTGKSKVLLRQSTYVPFV